MFKSILMPVKLNDPESWQNAFAVACRLARDHGAKLTLATIIPHWVTNRITDYSHEAQQRFQREAREGLNVLQTRASDIDCDTLVHWGSVPGSIIDMAEEADADLIVLAAEDTGIGEYLGARHLLRIATRVSSSVLLVARCDD